MPSKPFKQCLKPYCNELTRDAYCEKHKPTKQDKGRRKSATERGYNYRWQRYRLVFLAEHPLCQECLSKGIYVPATVVDHIKDHKGNSNLFWSKGNHQALCKQCHDKKTASTNNCSRSPY